MHKTPHWPPHTACDHTKPSKAHTTQRWRYARENLVLVGSVGAIGTPPRHNVSTGMLPIFSENFRVCPFLIDLLICRERSKTIDFLGVSADAKTGVLCGFCTLQRLPSKLSGARSQQKMTVKLQNLVRFSAVSQYERMHPKIHHPQLKPERCAV